MTLPGSYLTAIDRGSMRAGLEVRDSLPQSRCIQSSRGGDPRSLLSFDHKSFLRRMLFRYLPESMLENEKRRFVLPIAAIFRRSPKPAAKWIFLVAERTAVAWTERIRSGEHHFAARNSSAV